MSQDRGKSGQPPVSLWNRCWLLFLNVVSFRRNTDNESDECSSSAERTSLEVDTEMAADLLRANVRLEGERDLAHDELDQLTAAMKDLRADLDVWKTEYQRAQQELNDAKKRLASMELDYSRISSKCDVSTWASYSAAPEAI